MKYFLLFKHNMHMITAVVLFFFFFLFSMLTHKYFLNWVCTKRKSLHYLFACLSSNFSYSKNFSSMCSGAVHLEFHSQFTSHHNLNVCCCIISAPQSKNAVSTNIKHSRYIHFINHQSTSIPNGCMYIIMFDIGLVDYKVPGPIS